MSTLHVAVLTYVRPLEEIDTHIPAHVEWLKLVYCDGVFLASGRRVPRTGRFLLKILFRCLFNQCAKIHQVRKASFILQGVNLA